MKITFEEFISQNTWLEKELAISLTDEILLKASKDMFYDVKLIVNGVEIEPNMFNDIVSNIEKYVDLEAKNLVNIKLKEAEKKVKQLDELISDVCSKIRYEFDLKHED